MQKEGSHKWKRSPHKRKEMPHKWKKYLEFKSWTASTLIKYRVGYMPFKAASSLSQSVPSLLPTLNISWISILDLVKLPLWVYLSIPPKMSYDLGSPMWPKKEYYSTYMLNVKNLCVHTSLWVLQWTHPSGVPLISIRMEHTRIPLIVIDPISFLFYPHRNELCHWFNGPNFFKRWNLMGHW